MDERASEKAVADRQIIATARFKALGLNLSNFPTDGGMIGVDRQALPRIGPAIEIESPSLGAISGKLVWHNGGHRGSRLHALLHDAVVKQIALMSPFTVDRHANFSGGQK